MKHARLVFGIFFFLLLLSLMVYYSLAHNEYDPDFQYIVDHFEQYNGTKITVSGTVTSVNKTTNVLQVRINEFTLSISTTVSLNTTHPGDAVEAYGTLTSPTRLTAEKLLIIDGWESKLVVVRSLPAVPFVLYLFFRTWRFNPGSCRFERRRRHA